ncbi:NifU family protein [Candidatus Falkowbacteria bacterium]|nr:NifU family protein [Candidatus Falkowbacteria bacterium]
MEDKIKNVLEKIRPYLQMDGGDVEFAGFEPESGLLRVKLMGGCVGCPMSPITLQDGIGKMIMEEIPEVKKVEAV